MEKHNKFVNLAGKLWPRGHRRFQEMSVLAATGQLGGAQMYELNQHIGRCLSCRAFLESVAQVSVQALPLVAESRWPTIEATPPDGIRGRFLSRMASATKNPEIVPILELVPTPDRQKHAAKPGKKHDEQSGGAAEESPRAPGGHRFKWAAVTAVVGLAAGIAGFFLGVSRQPAGLPVVLPSAQVTHQEAKIESTNQIDRLGEQKSELQKQLTELRQRLFNAKLEQDSLTNELVSAKAKLAGYSAQTQEDSALSSTRSQETKNQISSLESQIERLNRRLADSDLKLGVQLQTTGDVTAKLEATESELQRTRDLNAAKSEASDLVAARNLHIIDVYDADKKGNRQRSYGRVFYVEGKSLIFYAYDLEDSARINASVVFRVWGEKAGAKEATHSLGILHNDDASQNRWAMTFDDPRVLTQINSVFVTAESTNKHSDGPRGKKILYAYFGGQANHP
jgi:hypothetical protein